MRLLTDIYKDIEEGGLTLVELLITLSLLSVLLVVGVFNFIGAQRKARDNIRIHDLEVIKSALELYKTDNGIYPWEHKCDSSIGFYGTTGCSCFDGINPGQSIIDVCGYTDFGEDWSHLVTDAPPPNPLLPESIQYAMESYLTKIPVDPINSTIYFYTYEGRSSISDHSCGISTGNPCNLYVLRARMESENKFYDLYSPNYYPIPSPSP